MPEELLEKKNRTLILVQTNPEGDMMYGAWKKHGYHADIIFKPQCKLVRALRRFWANYFLPGYSLWYGEWKKRLDEYDTVIIHADVRTRTVPGYIHRMKPGMRIIYWYWNTVNRYSLPELTRDKNIECWTFDPGDSEKYHMHRNIQYYYSPDESKRGNPDCDVYFIGHDMGRREKIKKFERMARENNIRVRIDLFRDGKSGIPYEEVQKRNSKAKAILELVQKGQTGCTLRALEALFLEKKLITDNSNIKSEGFYLPENIFILGEDDDRRLREFINTPYRVISGMKYRYDIDAWFSNFFI